MLTQAEMKAEAFRAATEHLRNIAYEPDSAEFPVPAHRQAIAKEYAKIGARLEKQYWKWRMKIPAQAKRSGSGSAGV